MDCPFVISKRKTRVGCPTVSLQAHLHLGGVDMGTVLHPGAVTLGVWTCLCLRRCRPGCRRGVSAHGGVLRRTVPDKPRL